MPLIMIVTAFAAFVGYGGAQGFYLYGKGDHDLCGEHARKLFVIQILISIF